MFHIMHDSPGDKPTTTKHASLLRTARPPNMPPPPPEPPAPPPQSDTGNATVPHTAGTSWQQKLGKGLALGAGLAGVAASQGEVKIIDQAQSQNALQVLRTELLHVVNLIQDEIQTGQVQVTLNPRTIISITAAFILWNLSTRKRGGLPQKERDPADREACARLIQNPPRAGELIRLLETVPLNGLHVAWPEDLDDKYIRDTAVATLIGEGWPGTEANAAIERIWTFVRSRADRPKRFDFFISYSHQDTTISDRLTAALRSAQQAVFLDTDSILIGNTWAKDLLIGILEALSTVLLISTASLASINVIEEGILASINRSLVPVIIDNVDIQALPRSLSIIQAMRLSQSEDLASIAETLLKHKRTPI